METTALREVALIQTPEGGALVMAPQQTGREAHEAIQACLAKYDLGDLPCFTMDQVPMDGRHNSKVDRPLFSLQSPRGGGRAPFSRLTLDRLTCSHWI